MANNAAALGRDLGAVAGPRAASEQAMRSGAPTITRQVPITDAGQSVPGCLLLLPVYAPGVAGPGERQQGLQGWVYASLRINALLAEVAAAVDGQLEFEAFDGDAAN